MKERIELRLGTKVKARNGDEIFVGDTIETVQGTRFIVVKKIDTSFPKGYGFFIEDISNPGFLYDLKPYMSPNIWII